MLTKIHKIYARTIGTIGFLLFFFSMLAYAGIAVGFLHDGIWQPVALSVIFLAIGPLLTGLLIEPCSRIAMRLIDEKTGDIRSKLLFFLVEAVPVSIMSSWAAFNFYLFLDVTSEENFWTSLIFSTFLVLLPVKISLDPHKIIEDLYNKYKYYSSDNSTRLRIALRYHDEVSEEPYAYYMIFFVLVSYVAAFLNKNQIANRKGSIKTVHISLFVN